MTECATPLIVQKKKPASVQSSLLCSDYVFCRVQLIICRGTLEIRSARMTRIRLLRGLLRWRAYLPRVPRAATWDCPEVSTRRRQLWIVILLQLTMLLRILNMTRNNSRILLHMAGSSPVGTVTLADILQVYAAISLHLVISVKVALI